MSKTVIINPVTRIEGHSKITLQLDDSGEVSGARFHVTEFRGFEKFCEGRSFREMPAITARRPEMPCWPFRFQTPPSNYVG